MTANTLMSWMEINCETAELFAVTAAPEPPVVQFALMTSRSYLRQSQGGTSQIIAAAQS